MGILIADQAANVSHVQAPKIRLGEDFFNRTAKRGVKTNLENHVNAAARLVRIPKYYVGEGVDELHGLE